MNRRHDDVTRTKRTIMLKSLSSVLMLSIILIMLFPFESTSNDVSDPEVVIFQDPVITEDFLSEWNGYHSVTGFYHPEHSWYNYWMHTLARDAFQDGGATINNQVYADGGGNSHLCWFYNGKKVEESCHDLTHPLDVRKQRENPYFG